MTQRRAGNTAAAARYREAQVQQASAAAEWTAGQPRSAIKARLDRIQNERGHAAERRALAEALRETTPATSRNHVPSVPGAPSDAARTAVVDAVAREYAVVRARHPEVKPGNTFFERGFAQDMQRAHPELTIADTNLDLMKGSWRDQKGASLPRTRIGSRFASEWDEVTTTTALIRADRLPAVIAADHGPERITGVGSSVQVYRGHAYYPVTVERDNRR